MGDPMMTSQLQQATDELARQTFRIAALHARAAERQEAELARADAADRNFERENERKRVDFCAVHQEVYDPLFRAHGTAGAPPPLADEYPGTYRRRMMDALIKRLPSSSRYANLKADSLGPEIETFEPEILAEVQREAEEPSYEGRPDSIDDPGSMRVRVDPTTGQRVIEWLAKESFIKGMSRPGQRARISDPRTLMGQKTLAHALWR
jgi:hypothetical protein